jgi:hypothetical protein
MIPRNSVRSDSSTEEREVDAVVLFVSSGKRRTRAYRGWKRALGSSKYLQMRKV